MDYNPWNTALFRGTENLQLTCTQYLKLLEIRTELEPHQIIKDHRFLEIRLSPEAALAGVWKSLEKRFHTPHKPAQLLLTKLTKGPTLKSMDASALFSYLILCQSAISLRNADSTSLQILDDPGTIDSLVNRLDTSLQDKWYEHRHTLPGRRESPTFTDFANWIETQADISRYQNNSRPTVTQSSSEVIKTTNKNILPYLRQEFLFPSFLY